MGSAPGLTELEQVSAEMSAELGVLCGHLNVLHAQLVAIAERALVTGGWGGHGIRSPEHWLAWQTGLSPARARQVMLMAKRRRELPVTFAAFAEGALSIDQAAAVAAHVRAVNDAEACAIAKQATVAQLTSLLSRYRYGNESARERDEAAEGAGAAGAEAAGAGGATGAGEGAEGAEAAGAGGATGAGAGAAGAGGAADAAAAAPRFAHGITPPDDNARARVASAPGRVTFGYDDDGRFFLHANLPPHEGARLDAALREAKDRLFRGGNTAATYADALVDIAERALASTTPSRAHRYRVYVHVDVEGAWLQAGPALPRGLLDRMLCDG